MARCEIDLSEFKNECLEEVIESFRFEEVKESFLSKRKNINNFQLLSELDYITLEKEYYLGVFNLDLSGIYLNSLISTIFFGDGGSILNGATLFFKENELYMGSTTGTSLTTLHVPNDNFQLICNPLKQMLTTGLVIPGDFIRVLSFYTTCGWELKLQLSKTETSILVKLCNTKSKQYLYFVCDLIYGTPPKYIECINMNKGRSHYEVSLLVDSILCHLGLLSNLNSSESSKTLFSISKDSLKIGMESNLLKVQASNISFKSEGLNSIDISKETIFSYSTEDLYSIVSQYNSEDILLFRFQFRDTNTGSLILESKKATHLLVPKTK